MARWPDLPSEAEAVEIVVGFPSGDGGAPPEVRAELLRELRTRHWLRVRVDELVWSNQGAAGGTVFELDVSTMTEAVLSGVAVVAVIELTKRLYRLLRPFFALWVVRLHRPGLPPVVYSIMADKDVDSAIDAIPADFEVTQHIERTVRRWRDGRWEVAEVRRTSGGPSAPPADLGKPDP